MEPRELEVGGHGGRPLPCALYGSERDRLAVVLPGASRSGGRLGGSPARPDLHYTRTLLVELGLGVLEVWWDAATKPDDGREWYRANAVAALAAAGEPRVRLLVGRSIGTIALSLLPEYADRASLWIAPLTTLAPVREALVSWRGPKLVVAGSADETFDPVAGVETVLVPEANHGFDVGDAAASARALADALDRMREWVSAAVG